MVVRHARLWVLSMLVFPAACTASPDITPNDSDETVDDPAVLTETASQPLGPMHEGTCPPPGSTPVTTDTGWTQMNERSYERRGGGAVWDGYEMLVAMGNRYSWTPMVTAYNPTSRTWRHLADAPLSERTDAFVVWTGNAMLVWGGRQSAVPDRNSDGALYDPCTNAWVRIRSAPIKWREGSTAVWATTTRELLVWGGIKTDGSFSNTGYAYQPSSNTWRAFTSSPLTSRTEARAVWAGNKMIVFGGMLPSGAYSRKAAAYDPAARTWTSVTTPSITARSADVGVASNDGRRAAFWGGNGTSDGAIFDTATGAWSTIAPATATLGSTFARYDVNAWWAGNRFYVWSGGNGSETARDGALWDATTRAWSYMPEDPDAHVATDANVVWTGTTALISGGGQPCAGCAPLANGPGALYRP